MGNLNTQPAPSLEISYMFLSAVMPLSAVEGRVHDEVTAGCEALSGAYFVIEDLHYVVCAGLSRRLARRSRLSSLPSARRATI